MAGNIWGKGNTFIKYLFKKIYGEILYLTEIKFTKYLFRVFRKSTLMKAPLYLLEMILISLNQSNVEKKNLCLN